VGEPDSGHMADFEIGCSARNCQRRRHRFNGHSLTQFHIAPVRNRKEAIVSISLKIFTFTIHFASNTVS
jgi:hypothetical protein